MPRTFRDDLLAEMQDLRTVDCHSHTCLRSEYYEAGPRSLFGLGSYFDRDIQSVTGKATGDLYADCESDQERWQRLRGVLDRARNVSYWRHNVLTFQELFDLQDDDVTDDNWRALNERIAERTADEGWYHHVTVDLCGLRTQVKNIPWFEDWEPEYFTAVLRMEEALELWKQEKRTRLEEHLDCSITDLASCREALEALVAECRARGAVGVKLAHAYRRTLHSEPVDEATAAEVLDTALRGRELTPVQVKRFEDHIIFFLAGLCSDTGLVFDIHTGVQGNWGHIPDSDPLLLLPLLHAHRSTRFNLYHAGYPYSREMGMLGKHCPNVWLNMAWMYVITMEGSRQTLSEWIDLVPGHRILGFGSDVRWPELVYGHLLMARSCIADVLADKVSRDFLSRQAARDLARMMLQDSPVEFYPL
jgi:predicted TIM-barrel fold metal-dependent hydrolase